MIINAKHSKVFFKERKYPWKRADNSGRRTSIRDHRRASTRKEKC